MRPPEEVGRWVSEEELMSRARRREGTLEVAASLCMCRGSCPGSCARSGSGSGSGNGEVEVELRVDVNLAFLRSCGRNVKS